MILRGWAWTLSVALAAGALAATAAIHGRNGVELGPPPEVAVEPVTDEVGGHAITDNYRWLEDQKSAETRAFIKAETAYTDSYFDQLQPVRERITKRMTELSRVDQTGMPQEREGALFFTRRLAAENQASIYMRPARFLVNGRSFGAAGRGAAD